MTIHLSHTDDIPLTQPVLFSNNVKASFVDTLLSPEHTSKATIAATVVPPSFMTRYFKKFISERRLDAPFTMT